MNESMRKVKITIEVEVPDDCVSVVVNRNGSIFAFSEKAMPHPGREKWFTRYGFYRDVETPILNWKETLTKVGE
jgi:hypothetical protein